ncbi:TPA: hypothetical protein P2R04_002385 [Aeromonas veronii]|nr:hypothetical protein [Aeromonas veronii]
MILHPKEILDNNNHYQFKAEANASLEYQLEKLIFICEKMGNLLDAQEKSHFNYFTDKECQYAIDSIIHNYSILIEYYYSWVIYSHIGTIKHKKLTYKPIKNIDDEINSRIDAVFEEHCVGVLEKSIDNGYYAQCKDAFIDAFSFLFIGKFHEVYVLNNFSKHNRILSTYAPKVQLNNGVMSVPFVHITKPTDSLLGNSILKCFFEYEITDSEKIEKDNENYFVKLFNSNSKYVCDIGNIMVYDVNGIEYVTSSDFSGILVESILDVTIELCSTIIDKVVKYEPESISRNKNLNNLKSKASSRIPKTMNNKLNF